MPALTETQRIEIALPARMLHALAMTKGFGCYDAAGNIVDANGHEEVVRLRKLLHEAALEPINDLLSRREAIPFAKRVMLRIDLAHEAVTKEWNDAANVKVGLAILYFTKALIDDGFLTLAEGSPVSEAVDLLIPMVEHGHEDPKIRRSAMKAARRVLRLCQARGLYAGVEFHTDDEKEEAA
jgi:hypothetical protein